ncbi:peptidase family M48-domain-containing protein [Cokeromyces recurvatus]|uniref:peptidase family M48-domain-containing protein n=1 Tax=Cokeromyces recurvatus TaxID=90255 RepID=UPI0022201031|nr:peptidase family M48-domain-containing protein [Cokeromyces recurvatus]KAI7903120.1 peptidase family M48-domain-containing protein [Cokeromyces recurvatus]
MFRQIFFKSNALLPRRSCHSITPIHSSRFQLLCKRKFHFTQPVRIPIVPIPAVILGALKSGKLVSLISLSSKTSLTLLPHTFRRQGSKGVLIAKILTGIPLFGFALLLLIGLDQAPNTSRLRLIYLTEEEENEIVTAEIDELLKAHLGLIVPKDNEIVMWLQTIVDNLTIHATDDIRDPIRQYTKDKIAPQNEQTKVLPLPADIDDLIVSNDMQQEATEVRPTIPKRNFEVNVIWDSSTLNAICVGSNIVVYNLLLDYFDYDTTKIAVILSHEIAHLLQRHFVEQHGFASLMLMLGDISRGVFWMVTESMGPYVNQKINESISNFIIRQTQTTYNRKLEKEADIVGLKLLAKAGYDPRAAIDVWQRMAELEEEKSDEEKDSIGNLIAKELSDKKSKTPLLLAVEDEENKEASMKLEYSIKKYLDTLVDSWFGTTHPPSMERVEYMREHMEEAIELYNEAIKLNGPPVEFVFSTNMDKEKDKNQIEIIEHTIYNVLGHIGQWLSTLYPLSATSKTSISKNNPILEKA